jgi:hypothetical protein
MTRGTVEIRDWQPDDLWEFWEILQGWPPWWRGANRPKTEGEFQEWWMEKITACMVTTDAGYVAGFTYLDPIHRGHWATPHIVKKKGYGNPAIVREILRSTGKFSLQRWLDEYDLQKYWTWTASISAVQLCLLLGFRCEGKVRHYIRTDAGWLDAWQLSLLREEAWKKTPIGNVLRLLAWKWWG